jgi:hypothetical protein
VAVRIAEMAFGDTNADNRHTARGWKDSPSARLFDKCIELLQSITRAGGGGNLATANGCVPWSTYEFQCVVAYTLCSWRAQNEEDRGIVFATSRHSQCAKFTRATTNLTAIRIHYTKDRFVTVNVGRVDVPVDPVAIAPDAVGIALLRQEKFTFWQRVNKGAKPLENQVNVQGHPYKLVERLILARVALAMHIEDMKMNLTKSFPGKDNVLGYCLVETYTCSDLFLPDGGRDYWYNDQSKYSKEAFATNRLKRFPNGDAKTNRKENINDVDLLIVNLDMAEYLKLAEKTAQNCEYMPFGNYDAGAVVEMEEYLAQDDLASATSLAQYGIITQDYILRMVRMKQTWVKNRIAIRTNDTYDKLSNQNLLRSNGFTDWAGEIGQLVTKGGQSR